MTLSERFAGQLAHPRGLCGRLLGQAMDLANARPLRLAVAELGPEAGERILDAGCGTGAALAALAATADCDLYGIDRSNPMIATARRRLGPEPKLICAAIEDMPRPWQEFDAVLALNVLYFADLDGAMVASLYRALRPGGRLVAYVTHRSSMERWSFARAGLHRLYDARELEAALIQGGCSRTSISIKDLTVAPGIRGLVAHAER